MIGWLKENYGDRASVHANEWFELEFLRKEVKRLKEELGIDEDAKSDGSENESEDSDDDYVDVLPAPAAAPKKQMRNSVSAEAFGTWNVKAAWKPTVIPKSQEVRHKIEKWLT